MQHFHATFSRYQDGDARISEAQLVKAEDFSGAHYMAQLILVGLRGADPDARFTIVELKADGTRGTECTGAHMFETREELSARVAEENAS